MGLLGLGTEELVVIVVIILLLFGANAIPKLARSLGRAQGEFKKAREEFVSEAAKGQSEGMAAGPSEEQLRKTARDLGIDDKGRDADELKRLIQRRLA
jgi:sec-independent protein translocase protein TatA